jgi:hypothetical protein
MFELFASPVLIPWVTDAVHGARAKQELWFDLLNWPRPLMPSDINARLVRHECPEFRSHRCGGEPDCHGIQARSRGASTHPTRHRAVTTATLLVLCPEEEGCIDRLCLHSRQECRNDVQ